MLPPPPPDPSTRPPHQPSPISPATPPQALPSLPGPPMLGSMRVCRHQSSTTLPCPCRLHTDLLPISSHPDEPLPLTRRLHLEGMTCTAMCRPRCALSPDGRPGGTLSPPTLLLCSHHRLCRLSAIPRRWNSMHAAARWYRFKILLLVLLILTAKICMFGLLIGGIFWIFVLIMHHLQWKGKWRRIVIGANYWSEKFKVIQYVVLLCFFYITLLLSHIVNVLMLYFDGLQELKSEQ
jgi:hypothetical protein